MNENDKHFTRLHRADNGRLIFMHYSCEQGQEHTIPVNCCSCNVMADYLCDFSIQEGQTCDRPLCSEHRVNLGLGLDYCFSHAAAAYSAFYKALPKEPPPIPAQNAWLENIAPKIRPRVVNLMKEAAFEVYLGNGHDPQDAFFHNPVPLDRSCPVCKQKHYNNEQGHLENLSCYKNYLWDRIDKESAYRQRVRDLESKTLGFGSSTLPCHGDLLADACVWLWSPVGLYRYPLLSNT